MVYGTLMRGHGNHHYLSGQEFIGEAETVEEYSLYISGIPFVYPDKKTSKIKGEVFKVVGEEAIRAMDGLEGHPGAYQRRETQAIVNGKEMTVWLYFYPHDRCMSYGRLALNGSYAKPEFEKEEEEV